MREYVGRLVSQKPEAVTDALRKFVADSGIPSAQLGANARICLGVGYDKDDPDVALASALVLVGLGEGAYDELIGYHLINGYGTPERGSIGLDWLDAATDALGKGATPLVTADQDNRLDLLETTSALLMVGETEATIDDPSKADGKPTTAAAGRRRRPRPPRPRRPRSSRCQRRVELTEVSAFTTRRAFVRSPASAVVAELVDAQR